MRTPLGTCGLSASGGTLTLVGRRGEGWAPFAANATETADALALLDTADHGGAHQDDAFAGAVPATDPAAPRFAPGARILWRYGRQIETARVIRDDDRGLVTWIPSGSARLEPRPVDGGHVRDIPLERRFLQPWRMAESQWTGQGIVRVAPTGAPWSVWFFRDAAGAPSGVYVNLELPHRRTADAVFTRDLVLDLWIDAEHPGSEDVWVKDADELEAAVAQGRFTPEQADAVRSLADRAGEAFIVDGSWPLDDGWERWRPTPEQGVPLALPDDAAIRAARRRSGATAAEG